jgi:hypothetical protein
MREGGAVLTTLVVLVRDAETVLKQWILSIKRPRDELVVIDLGSHDRTKEVARSLTPHVYDSTWRGDLPLSHHHPFDVEDGPFILTASMEKPSEEALRTWIPHKFLAFDYASTEGYATARMHAETALGWRPDDEALQHVAWLMSRVLDEED